jgi:CBS domain-containing protein
MRVAHIMSRDVVTIRESATCQDAVATMFRNRVRHLPVLDADGCLVGIVTDRDIRHHLFAPEIFREIGSVTVERLLASVKVGQVMSRPVVTVRPDDALEAATRMMLEDKVGSLPVVDRRRVVGIITETDLLRRIIGADRTCGMPEPIVVSYP